MASLSSITGYTNGDSRSPSLRQYIYGYAGAYHTLPSSPQAILLQAFYRCGVILNQT